jgi:hypothetical protein
MAFVYWKKHNGKCCDCAVQRDVYVGLNGID